MYSNNNFNIANCSFNLQDSSFHNNSADGLAGGGAVALVFDSPSSTINPNISVLQIQVANCLFQGNAALWSPVGSPVIQIWDPFFGTMSTSSVAGGALSLYFGTTTSGTGSASSISAVNVNALNVNILQSQFLQNSAMASFDGESTTLGSSTLGGAISIFGVSFVSPCSIAIGNNTSFFENSAINSYVNGTDTDSSNNNYAFGGAVSVQFTQYAQGCSVAIGNNCSFANNAAANLNTNNNINNINNYAFGGAFSAYFDNTVNGIGFTFSNDSVFLDNSAYNVNENNPDINNIKNHVYGGAVSIYYSDSAGDCSFSASSGIKFQGNSAYNVNFQTGNGFNNDNNAEGGAVSIFYFWSAGNCTCYIADNVVFNENSASNIPYSSDNFASGGGMQVFYSYGAVNSTLVVLDSAFTSNAAGLAVSSIGGAINLQSLVSCVSCSVMVMNTQFVNNSVAGGSISTGSGGSINLLLMGETLASTFQFIGLTMKDNLAQSGGIGGALALLAQNAQDVQVIITDCTCSGNSASGQAFIRGFGGAVSVSLISSLNGSISVSTTVFTDNYANIGSALILNFGTSMGGNTAANASMDNIVLLSRCRFSQNMGNLGGALAIVASNENDTSTILGLKVNVVESQFFNNSVESGSGAATYLSLVSVQGGRGVHKFEKLQVTERNPHTKRERERECVCVCVCV